MNNSALAIYGQFEMLQQAALALYASGYFAPDVKSKEQAVVKILAGAELGLPPFASMSGIHIIQGKPALGANVIATLVKNDPRYDYRVREMTDKVCRIEFFEGGVSCGVSEFTAEDAKKALTKNMDKFPKNMLFARAMSNGAKWFCPGIFGGAPVYTPEELGMETDEDGVVIEGELVAEPKTAPKTTRKPTNITERMSPSEIPLSQRDDYEQHVSHAAAAPPTLPSDEQLVLETTATNFVTMVSEQNLIPRYAGNQAALRAAAKELGYVSVPRDAQERVELYKKLKAHAAELDAAELAEVEAKTLFPLHGGGAYAE